MGRNEGIAEIEGGREFELAVIGGGATGLGVAVEAASRGLSTVLIDRHDFCKGTSSRSTKLIHGGVRYLAQGNARLVIGALTERGRLLENAGHVVKALPLIVPFYRWWEAPYYLAGLKLYDALAGRRGIGHSVLLSREKALTSLPTLSDNGLRGGILFYDGQFDDARLAVSLARTASSFGAKLLNYVRALGLEKREGRLCGISCRDESTGREFAIRTKAVVNATGVFADEVRKMDDPAAARMIEASQGSHLVLSREFLPSDCGILVPKTDDARVLFAIPWHDRVLAGTTDFKVDHPELEPRPLEEEVEFILRHLSRYLARAPRRSDILSMFAGLRPLIRGGAGAATKALSRDHSVIVSPSGLVSVLGGKWTTYRKMGEDAVDRVSEVAGLDPGPSRTSELKLHGASDNGDSARCFGRDEAALARLIEKEHDLAMPLAEGLPYQRADVIWAGRSEWALTVEDVLARRTRLLLLDARASIEAAPDVAALLARELGRDSAWVASQVEEYRELAQSYLP